MLHEVKPLQHTSNHWTRRLQLSVLSVACPCIQAGNSEAVTSASSLTAFPLYKGPALLSSSQLLANFAESCKLEQRAVGLREVVVCLIKEQRQELHELVQCVPFVQGVPPRSSVSSLCFHL